MPRDLAARLASALNVRSQTAISQIDRALSDYARLVPQAGATPLEGEIDTSQVTSGTFADARIAASNVTQHQGAINHDALTNYVAGQHIAWAQAGAEVIQAGRVPEAAVTQHEAALNITEIQITDLGNYPEKDVAETIPGAWQFTAGVFANGNAEITFERAAVADDATQAFAIPRWGLVAVLTAVGTSTAYHGLFWVASGSVTTAAIDVGANFSLGTSANPDVDTNINAWMSADGELSVKNRQGATRGITVFAVGHA